ncbi:hypothetical protein GPECTOR_77g5 [Gonium pectorale]|uniref:Hexosyltransferase n=1 Tax=Gonium pectorale TaxID=33097 RepID=A0A150G2B5_GONPE|nr:hypothetical protein GPECTOR_77g5 [Gonium pectorale]|eukprot:KXZ43951.1 hypothetical protein GPECTOR_77g5 [Gonium pectorale]
MMASLWTTHNARGQPAADRRYDYALRRAAIRASWMRPPGGAGAGGRGGGGGGGPAGGGSGGSTGATGASAGGGGVGGGLNAGRSVPSSGSGDVGGGGGGSGAVVVRFVAGFAPRDPAAEAALSVEAEAHGDFMRLRGVEECYTCLPNKTRAFFVAALAAYPSVRWVLKMDDDVFLIPQRLPPAAAQWERMGAGYIGCMKHGYVFKEPGARWYEPQHLLLGPAYYLHAYGSAYVLSSEVVRRVILPNYHSLRLQANEGKQGYKPCHPAALAVLRVECAGLCAPLEDLAAAARNGSCAEPPYGSEYGRGHGGGNGSRTGELPYMPSYPDHAAFERMWV